MTQQWEGRYVLRRSDSEMEQDVRRLLYDIGDEPEREGLDGTPERVVRAWREIFSGYSVEDPASVLKWFTTKSTAIVQVSGIEFSSMCEHHWLPFWGTVTIRYAPGGEVIGVSKLSRLVDVLSHRLQIQENLAQQIADTIQSRPSIRGVFVDISSQHTCMSMRGVKQTHALMSTQVGTGIFEITEGGLHAGHDRG